jgi:predicted transposase/invertase (TIGR01784 family)
MNADEEMQEIARMREKAKMAEASAYRKAQKEGLERGLKQGIQQGMQKGRQEGVLFTAKGFLDLGIPIDVVAKATGLSEIEVEKLKSAN